MSSDSDSSGLPLVAFDIDYVRERAEEDHAALLLPRDDMAKAAAILSGVIHQPDQLAALARAALAAAEYHAAENWYRRRAEWTFEAVARHQASAR